MAELVDARDLKSPAATDNANVFGKTSASGPAETAPNPAHLENISDADCRTVFERDDGKWSIGLADDAPGPFESKRHAEAVAIRYSGDDPPPKRRRPGSGKPGRYSLVLDAAATHTYANPELLSSRQVLPTDAGQYRAVAPNGLLIGSFKTRPEAAQASEVRS